MKARRPRTATRTGGEGGPGNIGPRPLVHPFLSYLLLPLLSAFLVSLSLGMDILPRGLGPLGWVALVPLFSGLREGESTRGRLATCLGAVVAGGSYGFGLAFLGHPWVAGWHAGAPVILGLYLALCYGLALGSATLLRLSLPRFGGLLLPFLWAGVDLLRSQGPLAFPYGLLALTQYRAPALLGLAHLGGIHLLNLAMAGCNALLLGLLAAPRKGPSGILGIPWVRGLAALGLLVPVGLGSLPGWPVERAQAGATRGSALRVGLIQQAPPPRVEGLRGYEASFAILKAESEAALAEGADLLVWPESAIVPSLTWHLKARPDREVDDFCLKVDAWITALPVPLLFGNALTEGGLGTTPQGRSRRDWNAAVLAQGRERQTYRKSILVPLAETVPAFLGRGAVARWLLARNDGGWEAGEGPLPLSVTLRGKAGDSAEVVLGTPLCFEDGFGAYCRGFVRAGAQALVVLTSDAWAASEAEAWQHLAQSVLRAAETGLPVLRATSTGITASISPSGRLEAFLPPGRPGHLLVDLVLPAGTGVARPSH